MPKASAPTATEYDALPESVKATYSYREWLWLPDDQKARLIEIETTPDDYDLQP